MRENNDVYFANDEPKETVCYLQAKGKDWFDGMITHSYLQKVKKSWDYYHGIYFEEDHGISYGGEVGELTNIAVNHYQNIAKHILTMVTSSKPAFQAKAINTDHKSQVQVTLANELLEYYMKVKKVDKKLKETTEKAIVLSTGYMKVEWNSTKGKIYDYVEPEPMYDEDGNELKNEDGELIDLLGNVLEKIPVYEGDLEFKSLDPLNVMFDVSKDSWDDQEWVVVRSFVNRHVLCAKYPELADKIMEVPTKDRKERRGGKVSLTPLDETDDVAVYELFHERNEATPNGKYMLYLNEECILEDGPMPYRNLPVYRIAPSNYIGTSFGYTNMWDIMPLQEAVNSIYSTILSNQTAFGVQNILNPEGNNLKVSEISGALNFLDYTPVAGAPNGGRPEALNLTKSPAECFQYLQMLERAMETISGINAVTRGNPEQNLRSGNALALIQAQAIQYISGIQEEYVRLVEDVGTAIIEILQDYAEAPRIAEIVGKSNLTKVKEFSRDNLDKIQRVTVEVGNALSKTTAGRTEMASNLMQMGLITTPEQYFAVLNTGNLETMTEGPTKLMQLIKAENEALVAGEDVIALILDDHDTHIREHLAVLSDPVLRFDNELVQRVLLHIQEHKDLEMQAPQVMDKVTASKQSPPPPPQNVNPMATGGQVPPSELMAQEAQMGYPPEAVQQAAEAGVSMPTPPVDPTTGQPLTPQG